MGYIITSQCISCNRCQFECPTGAIKQVEQRYWIDPSLCNNCVGHYSVPQCVAACPTNGGCIPDVVKTSCNHPVLAKNPDPSDYWDSWFSTYNRLMAKLHRSKQSGYWDHWFDKYSQEVSKHISDLRSREISRHLSHRQHETAGAQA